MALSAAAFRPNVVVSRQQHQGRQLRAAAAPVRRTSSAAPRRGHGVLVRAASDAQRKEIIERFFSPLPRADLEAMMADGFTMREDGGSKVYSKADYVAVLCDCVRPAVPDFSWGAATNGETDADGWAIATVSATGHHTGEPLRLPGLAPVPPSGKHFCLAEEVQKVKVVDGKVAEIQVLPTKGAGPRALYVALGGQLPAGGGGVAVGAPPMP